jgi:methionyl-tRNA formyltransferase
MAEAAEGRRLKLVFMGTPDFAATVLRHVLGFAGGEVLAVYTQPDRPCGRGRVCKPGPVKELAVERGLPVLQPQNFKDPDEIAALAALAPDVLLVAAYGLILPQAVLDVARLGAINVHASLLPRYRGAAPIQRVILDGEPVTGISIMRMEAGLDSGPVLLQRALGIGVNEDAGQLHDELAELGGRLLVEALGLLAAGMLHAQLQDHSRATYAPKLSREDGLVDFNQPAQMVHNRIRAMYPRPGAFTYFRRNGEPSLRLGLHPGEIGPELSPPAVPGTFLGLVDGRLAVACADRLYYLSTVHPQGRKAMDARAFHCGYLADAADTACSGQVLADEA